MDEVKHKGIKTKEIKKEIRKRKRKENTDVRVSKEDKIRFTSALRRRWEANSTKRMRIVRASNCREITPA